MTTQARELAKIVTNAGDLSFSDDITLASDASVLNFGADSDVTLTHVADTGLLLNSSRQLQFGDSGTFIRQEADGVLDITSDTEVEINATTVDINANVDISGNLVLGGNITIGDADSDDISFGGELTSHIVPNADDTYDLGSSTKQWRNLYVDGSAFIDTIDGTDEISITNTATDSNAGPILNLWRNSASPADADYLGQIKFSGEDDGGTATVYSKITGKIGDASNSSEDGIIEFAAQKAGSQTILARLSSTKLELTNSTALEVGADVSITAGALSITGDGSNAVTFTESGAGLMTMVMADDFVVDAGGDIHLDADGADITFKDAGTVKMILKDGDLGIGTASPDSYNSNTRNLVIRDSGSGGITISTGASNTGYIAFNDGEDTTIEGLIAYNQSNDVMSFRTAGTDDRLAIDGSGNVGIGTASPSRTLDINHASTAPDLRLGCDGNDRSLIILDADRSSAGNALGTIVWRWNNTDTAVIESRAGADTTNKDDGGLTFMTRTSGSALADAMHIDSSQNVGIGTTSPGALLDIAASTNNDYPLKIRGNIDNSGGYTGIVFGYESDTTAYEKAAIHVEGTSGNVEPNFHILLHDGANNTNATLANAAKFSILNDGHLYGEVLINSNVNPTGENSGKMWSTSGTWTSIWNVGSDPEGVRYYIECDIQGLDGYTSYGYIYKDRNGRWRVDLRRQAGTNVQVDSLNTYIQVTQGSGANQTNSSGNVRLTRLMGTGATAIS